MEWCEDGWPRLAAGGRLARREVEAPDLPEHPFEPEPARDDFDSPELNVHFQSLRVPMTPDWVSLEERPGHLRLRGRESLGSAFRQSLVARRVQAHHVEASTVVEFDPANFQQMAGLVCYYNTGHYHYLYVHGDDFGGDPSRKFISVLTCNRYAVEEPEENAIEITGAKRVHMKVDFDRAGLRFFYRLDEGSWQAVGGVLDGSILSDDYVENIEVMFRPCFTGAFVGLACQDLSGQGLHADFDWFEYREL
jgi:xylan 1,4-beta-xylosidase